MLILIKANKQKRSSFSRELNMKRSNVLGLLNQNDDEIEQTASYLSSKERKDHRH